MTWENNSHICITAHIINDSQFFSLHNIYNHSKIVPCCNIFTFIALYYCCCSLYRCRCSLYNRLLYLKPGISLKKNFENLASDSYGFDRQFSFTSHGSEKFSLGPGTLFCFVCLSILCIVCVVEKSRGDLAGSVAAVRCIVAPAIRWECWLIVLSLCGLSCVRLCMLSCPISCTVLLCLCGWISCP